MMKQLNWRRQVLESLHHSVVENRNLADPALVLYRNEASRHDVLKFYTRITNDEQVSKIILDNASKNNIPPALAFALAWQESRYQIRAVNKNPIINRPRTVSAE